MGVGDGVVKGIERIHGNGSKHSQFNLVLVAEGFTADELSWFAAECNWFVQRIFATPPFDDLSACFNIYRLDIASTDSGADDPVECGGTGAAPRTYFDATFCSGGIARALTVDTKLVMDTVDKHLPEYHSVQVLVNSPIYGGTGGAIGVSSNATTKSDGTPVDWSEIMLHEMGHTIFGLADEYGYLKGCDEPDPGHDEWPLWEPAELNVTTDMVATKKWSDLITASNLPTTWNSDCTKCDEEPNPEPDGTVGTYQGAHTYRCGIYRPEFDCMMRKLGRPFCAVCSRVIRETMAQYEPRPEKTLDLSPIDWAKWQYVAQPLFGVIQDGGGVLVVGGKPMPIDPWGPLRTSLVGTLADPKRAHPVLRDLVVALAVREMVGLFGDAALAAELVAAADDAVERAAAALPPTTIR